MWWGIDLSGCTSIFSSATRICSMRGDSSDRVFLFVPQHERAKVRKRCCRDRLLLL